MKQVSKDGTAARQGERRGHMTTVLILSVFLTVTGFAAFFGYTQFFTPQQDTHAASNSAGK